MVQNYKCMESKRTQLDLLAVKIMCRKQKLSRVFGRALGRHRKIERQKHVGRPIYQLKKGEMKI